MNIAIIIAAAAVTFAEGTAPYLGEPSDETVNVSTIEEFKASGYDMLFLDTNKTHEAVVEYVQVRKEEYDVLTSRFEKVWSSFHGTEEGRIRIHGSRKSQIVTDTQKLTTYADGYTHAENIVKRVPRPRPAATNRIERKERIIRGTERYKEFKRCMEERKKNKPKEVTVEHDAVTGKDTEVK